MERATTVPETLAPTAAMLALRDQIVTSPLRIALHRARVYTRVWQASEGAPWIILKATAFREYLRTVPLYLRDGDRLAGVICEIPGGMPVFVELGIAENGIYTSENPHRAGYLDGQVPADIRDYWETRNLWARVRKHYELADGKAPPRGKTGPYTMISNPGHLSPSYAELLRIGLGGLIQSVADRRSGETDPDRIEFLTAADLSLRGVSEWIGRHAVFLAEQAAMSTDPARADDLRRMADIANHIALLPPRTFREAMQLIWFIHQAIHIEGHGYSNTPDRIDQLLHPFYQTDRTAGRLDEAEALCLCENFLLKQRDNSFWGPEHNLTQGLCVGGSTPDGGDQTNDLSWLFVRASGNLSMPEPLIWVRWHPNINPAFFDFCLENLRRTTCFPLMMGDPAVVKMWMAMGVGREDAFNCVPVGCNEIALPGQAYYQPLAGVDYLGALRQAMAEGGQPPTYEDFLNVVEKHLRAGIHRSYLAGLREYKLRMRYNQTPLTSCFFDGCIDRAQDLCEWTKYNICHIGGVFVANFIDSLAAIRQVVYEDRLAGLPDVITACDADFEGHETLRVRLLAAPKHGNDDPRLDRLIERVRSMRDSAVRDFCRDYRDGSEYASFHVVRNAHMHVGRHCPATPDGRRRGQPLASSIAASADADHSGPTALLNSILKMKATESWRGGYNVNMRLSTKVLDDPGQRRKVAAMLGAFFAQDGQEVQINCVDSATLRAAQADPDSHRNLVVRIAGFSEYFVRLPRDFQDEIIARTEHDL